MVSSSGLHNVRGRSTTIIIAFAAVISLLFLPLTVFAQVQQEETSFLTYENPTYGIFMQYPSNWIASTSGLADHTDLIAFYSPLRNVSDLSQARLIISVIIYSQNVSLQEYTNYLSTILNQSEQVDVTSSSEVDIAGYLGHRVVLANQPNQNTTLTFYQMNTWTTIGNKVYFLTYQGEERAFNQYLPEVNRMLQSLTIEEVI
jgi:hypothetical protein